MSGQYYYDPSGQYGYYDANVSSSSTSYQYQDHSSPGSSSNYSSYSNHSMGSTGDAYQCLVPGCNKYFTRPTDLDRHYNTVHCSTPKIECPHKWCGRYGDRGFTRQDHFRDHLREVHQEDIPKSRKPPKKQQRLQGTINPAWQLEQGLTSDRK